MKLVGNLLIWICIALGVIAATSFYAWPLGPDASADARFELGIDDDGATRYARLLQPLPLEGGDALAADAPLDPDALALLRAAGYERAIVKHPSGAYQRMLANWSGKWLFLISAAGLVGGAVALRAAARSNPAPAKTSRAVVESAEAIAGRIRAAIADLRASLATSGDDRAREHAIIETLGEVQAELVPAFVDTRPALIGKRGMGGFAAVMDNFAAMERQINRSWSAAADGHLPESLASLDAAALAAEDLAVTLGIPTPN